MEKWFTKYYFKIPLLVILLPCFKTVYNVRSGIIFFHTRSILDLSSLSLKSFNILKFQNYNISSTRIKGGNTLSTFGIVSVISYPLDYK